MSRALRLWLLVTIVVALWAGVHWVPAGERGHSRSVEVEPQRIAETRLDAIQLGMPETRVRELLGEPFSTERLTAPNPEVPDKTNREPCDEQSRCTCSGAVDVLFYYRGSAGVSLYVFIDARRSVCCLKESFVSMLELVET